MTDKKLVIEYYATEDGRVPVKEWLLSLNKNVRSRIRLRIDRILLGNFGDHHPVQGKIAELRFKFGSGYRIYYGILKNEIVLLLSAGDKSTQKKDIEKALRHWKDYLER